MSSDKVPFQKLTPIKDFDLDSYEEALNFVFKNEDIRNIAITGPYGAGKTSLIETYKKKYGDKKYINISLAHFKSDKNEIEIDENVLEGKILNQLIHQIDSDKIPKTNFKVKQTIRPLKIFGNTVLLVTLIILILYMFFFGKWRSYILYLPVKWIKEILLWTTKQEFLIIAGIFSLVIIVRFIYVLMMIQNNRNIFKKFNLQGNEVEIFEESDESYFDKYLNEVLYIFNNSEAEAIIFEDIDRYDVSQIFGKLREINILVNNRRIRTNQNPIRFIFLLRDDVFFSKDRTKFFDFIIPVIPVIDASNSYEQFIEHFKENDLIDIFDSKFLQRLALYIDDMRILKNIYNEFFIYKNRLNLIELDPNKLLALISYKNIFPKDFSDLQMNSGFVYTLFFHKKDFILNILNQFDSEIAKKELLLKKIKNETLISIEELEVLYFTSNFSIISINGNDISSFKNNVEVIRCAKKYPLNVEVYYRYRSYPEKIDFNAEIKKIYSQPDFLERKKIVESKMNTEIKKISTEIQKIKKEKEIIQNHKLSKIITRENVDEIFRLTYINEIGEENDFKQVKGNPYFPMIKFLIRNGYIDESYPDYMTYFYENSLSVTDKIFLRGISDQIAKEYEYELTNPDLVISRLNVLDFKNEEILNFSLLCHLLKNSEKYKLMLNEFMLQLKLTANLEFLGRYLELEIELESLIKTLNYIWPSIFENIIEANTFGDDLKKKFTLDLLYYSSQEELMKLNENGYLSEYISFNDTFLNISEPDIDKIYNSFKTLNIKFIKINYEESEIKLFNLVYTNHFYELNQELIELFLEKKYKFTRSKDYITKNYTLISSNKEQPLYAYISKNMDEYLKVLLKNKENKIYDDEMAVIELLNDSNVSLEDKEDYLELLQTKITNLMKIEEKAIWDVMLDKKKISFNYENILDYFIEYNQDLNLTLIQFINNAISNIEYDSENLEHFYGESVISNLFNKIVKCEDISNESYKMILSKFNRIYNSFGYSNITKEKVAILVDIRVIKMTKENLLFLRNHYKEIVILFNKKNIKSYIELIDGEYLELDEMKMLLSENIDDKYKLDLLKLTDEKISLDSSHYSEKIKFYILNNNFEFEDIPFLIQNYTKQKKDFKDSILKVVYSELDKVLKLDINLPYIFLKDLLEFGDFEEIEMKKLFVMSLSSLNKNQAKEIVEILSMNEYLGLFNLKRPRIEITDLDKQILTIFKQNGWITKFEVDKENNNFYRAYGRSL